jgi:hypothetical protein
VLSFSLPILRLNQRLGSGESCVSGSEWLVEKTTLPNDTFSSILLVLRHVDQLKLWMTTIS